MKRFFLTFSTAVIFLSSFGVVYAQDISGIRDNIANFQSAIDDQKTSLSGLKDSFNAFIDTTGSPFASGEPSSSLPVNQTVKPNFSSIVTGNGPSEGSGGTITEDGILVVQTEGEVGFAIQAQSGSGVLSKASEIGVFSTGSKFGIISQADTVSSYASSPLYGLYVNVPSAKIGIKSASESGYGTYASGQYGAYGFSDYGLLSYGGTQGVLGYFNNGSSETWGALGYFDGRKSYGFYTPYDTFISEHLSSGIIGVGDEMTTGTSFVQGGDLVAFENGFLDMLVAGEDTGIISWDSMSDHVGILSDYTEIAGDLDAENMTVSEGFYVNNGTTHIGTGWIKADQDFNIESGLNVLSGSVHSTGNIRGNRIGSFYFRESSLGSNVSKSCDSSKHLLVGCSAQIASIQDTPFGLQKVKRTGTNTCSASFYNAQGYAYAYCFDPRGETSDSDSVHSINLEVPEEPVPPQPPCEPWPNCVEPPTFPPPSDFGYLDFTSGWRWVWRVTDVNDPCFYDALGCLPPVMEPKATDCASGSAFCPDNAVDYASWVDEVADAFNSVLNGWDGTDPRNGRSLTGDLTVAGIAFLLDTGRKDMDDFNDAGVSESKINDALELLAEYHQGSSGWEDGASDDYDQLIEDAYTEGYIDQDIANTLLQVAGYSQTDIDTVLNRLTQIDPQIEGGF